MGPGVSKIVSKLLRKDADEANLLCLNCRSVGHVVVDCLHRQRNRWPRYTWSFDPKRALLLQDHSTVEQELCQRCKDIDILSMFDGNSAWSYSTAPIEASLYSESQHYRNLGNVETVRFNRRCGLCMAIFNLAPGPGLSRGNLYLLTDHIIHRLEGAVNTKSHLGHLFDTCVVAEVFEDGNDLKVGEHHGDVLALRRSYLQGLSCTALAIEPEHFDVKGLSALLTNCEHAHEFTCLSKKSDSLSDITFVDVTTRRLLPYPGPGCKYLALSYVWGDVDAPKPDRDGTLRTMPATIEDAMRLTLAIGKRYVWIDAVCIDQEDEDRKARQIRIMADIYRGAYATIVALSGTSSEHGLTRLRRDRKTQPQLSCAVNGLSLLGLMPTLSSQIAHLTWGRRSWTLQEALLSQRSIYFTDHQVYFECNAMQCCETIDTSNSWIHNTPRDVNIYTSNPNGQVLGHGTLRNAVVLQSQVGKHRFPMRTYNTLLNLYSRRQMRYDTDALDAFSAILQHLKEVQYKDGFCCGLPEHDLNWSLLWSGRRELVRRDQFPAWSWAGWRGEILPNWPSNEESPVTQPYWTHFYAWTSDGASMRQVFPRHEPSKLYDPLFRAHDRTPFDLEAPPQADRALEQRCRDTCLSAGYLLLDCFVFRPRLIIDNVYPSGNWTYYRITLNSVVCHIRLPDTVETERVTDSKRSGHFLLTGRDKLSLGRVSHVVHHFLDVDIDDEGKASRQGVMHLYVPEHGPQALTGLKVARRCVILI